MAGNHREEDFAIAIELAAADARNDAHRHEIARPPPHHLDQGRVMEDDVRRQPLLAREVEAAFAQRLPQSLIGRTERSLLRQHRRAAIASPARLRLLGLAAKSDLRLAT